MNGVQHQHSAHMLYFKNLYLYEHYLQQALKTVNQNKLCSAKSWFNYFWVYDSQAGQWAVPNTSDQQSGLVTLNSNCSSHSFPPTNFDHISPIIHSLSFD